MKALKIGTLSLLIMGISACSTLSSRGYFKDETQSYQREGDIQQTVVIPQNLSARNVQDYYEVPQPCAEAVDVRPPITPPGSSLTSTKSSQPGVVSQQDKIRFAESAKIHGHTNPTANGPKPVGVNYSQAWVKVGHILQAAKYKIVEKDNAVGTYYVIDSTKAKKRYDIYQVHLKASGNGTMVTVSPANPELQNQLNRSLND